MLILPIEVSQTAATGAWSFNSPKINGGLLHHVVVKAASTDTTFDFTITDEKDNVIYAPSTATGTLRAEVVIPVRGILTLAVASASADEAFTGRLTVKEKD